MLRKLIFLAPVLLLSASCHKSLESQLEGDWQQKSGASGFEKILSSMVPQIKLTLRQDQTFTMKLPGLNLQVSDNSEIVDLEDEVEGTWTLNGDQVMFKAKTDRGKPIAQREKEVADEKAAAESAARQKEMQENMDRANQASQASETAQADDMYGNPPENTQEQAPASSPPPTQPDMSNVVSKESGLVLPASAILSSDGRTLTLRFVNTTHASVDLDKT